MCLLRAQVKGLNKSVEKYKDNLVVMMDEGHEPLSAKEGDKQVRVSLKGWARSDA